MAGEGTVAAVYAQALAGASGPALPQVEEAFDALLRAWREVPELRVFLAAPGIPTREKVKALAAALPESPPVFLDFLGVTAGKGRLGILPEIHAAFRDLRDSAAGRVRAAVSTATAMAPGQAERIQSGLKDKLGKDIVLEASVRPELLGGVRIQIGDWVADGTLKRKIATMRRQIAAAPLPGAAWSS